MHHHSQPFLYTGQRQRYLQTVGGILALALVEGALIGGLMAWLVPLLWLKLLLTGSLFSILGWSVYAAMSPLRTQYTLDDQHLHLHFGAYVRVAIPRTAIATARLATPGEQIHLPGARYDARQRRLVIVLASVGQVVLTLAVPQQVRVGLFSGGMVQTILLNVDQPQDLLAAFAQPSEPHVPPAQPSVHPSSTAVRSLPSGVALHAEGLTRRFGDFTAVDGLHLALAPGEIYGFLGANGAGKTTTIKLLVGLLHPHAGCITLTGHDLWDEPLAARAAFGYVADHALLYDRLTGREFLHFLAQMRGLPLSETDKRCNELLALLDLARHADRACDTYSFGMQRKLALAGALLHRPAVLILDEPLTGLDPVSARRLKDLLSDCAAEGTAILFSTHDLATAESICHRIGILHAGRLIAEDSPTALRTQAAAPDLEAVFLNLTAQQTGGVA